MVENGVLNEAKWLYDNYREVQAARAIGYKELFPTFQEKILLKTVLEKIKTKHTNVFDQTPVNLV